MAQDWTDDDDKYCLQLFEAGRTTRQIAFNMDRPYSAVSNRLRFLRGKPVSTRIRRKAVTEIRSLHRVEASREMWEDANKRNTAPHRDLTAEFFGDPKPGFSALDRRS